MIEAYKMNPAPSHPTHPSIHSMSNFAFINFHRASDAQLSIDGLDSFTYAGSALKVGWAKAMKEEGEAEASREGRPKDAEAKVERARSKGGSYAPFQLNDGKTAAKTPVGYTGIDPSIYGGGGGAGAGAGAGGGVSAEMNADAGARGGQRNAALEALEVARNKASDQLDSLDQQEEGATVKSGEGGNEERNRLMMKLAARAGMEVAVKATTDTLIVKNCFDPSTETQDNWWLEIEDDMKDECAKFGKVLEVKVWKDDAEGKVRIKFETAQQAEKAGKVFDGRWFGERQLRVAYV